MLTSSLQIVQNQCYKLYITLYFTLFYINKHVKTCKMFLFLTYANAVMGKETIILFQ